LETRDEERAKRRGWNANDDSDGEGGHPPLVGNVDDDGDGGGELPPPWENGRMAGENIRAEPAGSALLFLF